jgi:phage gp29-like protein
MAKRKASQKRQAPLTDPISIVSLLDRYSTYPSRGLTPQRLASLMRDADSGDITRQMELAEEMLEKDGLLTALNSGLRLAVSRLPYSIIPASDDKIHVDIAGKVDKMIKKVGGWKNSIGDLADCYFKGFAALQIPWQVVDRQYTFDRLRFIHQKKFRFGKFSEFDSDPDDLRLILDPRQVEALRGIVPESELTRASSEGISLDADPRLRQGFIVCSFRPRAGDPARTNLIRPISYLFMFKNFDVKWWIQFAEVQLGYRIGKYDSNQPEQKALLEQAIRGLATDAAAVISKESEIKFEEMLQKASSHQVYKEIKEFCSEEMMQVFLGHTGTAQSTPGKLGSENAAESVLQQRIEALAEAVDESITDDIIVPYVDLNIGPQEEYPYYKTASATSEDLDYLAGLVIKVQQTGYPISKKWMKERFGIPLPNPNDPEDEVLTPIPLPGPQVQAKGTAVVGESKKKLLIKR